MNTSGLSSASLGVSTGQRMQESKCSEPCNTSKFMNRIKSDLQVQKHQKCVNRELHQKRIQNLRKELDYLKATEWKYQSVDW
jgi:RNA helicase armi